MQSDVLYEHRQTGYVVVGGVVVALAILALVAIGASTSASAFALTPIAIFLGVLAGIFSSMTVRVTRTTLEWWIGIKPLGVRVALDEIESVEPIKTNLFEGWGIHLTWHGWVWNVAGFNALQVKLKRGTRYAVGTPEPDKVIAAIRTAKSA